MTADSKTQAIKDWLGFASQELASLGALSPRLDVELLASFVLGKTRTWLHAHSDYEISQIEQKQLDGLVKRRLTGEPIAYIVGRKEFYGCNIYVTSDVLVPRPESEDFIEIAKQIPRKSLKFIDVGTGSGVLAIMTALEQPTWSGVATDISPEALKVAQKNAQKLGAKNLVFKVQSLLANDAEKYDVLIANLPYVPKNLRGKADIAHEPEIALFADNDGLALYEELFQQIAGRRHKPTNILTESLLDQHYALKGILEKQGYKLRQTKGFVQHFERG